MSKKIFKNKIFFILVLIFLISLLVYFLSNVKPQDWYKHYVYLASSLLQGRFDLPDLPSFYHDKIMIDNKIYIPFPPAPAFILMPLVAIWGTDFNQAFISMIIGAVNIILIWLLLQKLKIKIQSRLLLTSFFAFGTVHWYAASIGTTWFFAHVVAIFFLLLAILITLEKKKLIFAGFLLGLAILSRHPILFSLPFFLILLPKKKKEFFSFFLGLSFPLTFQLFYNFVRFANIFGEGYFEVYRSYLNPAIPYSFYRFWVPENFPHFGYLDIRNIPLHFYTLLLMPPEILIKFPFIKPSPYGLSILITSPLFIYALRANWQEKLTKACWIAIFLTSIPIFLHFSQGWVQFGYRFILDFAPFLLILTALGMKNKITPFRIFLVLFSIGVNLWGIYWGKVLGW